MIDHLSEQYTNAILSSDPKQADQREENYHLHNALQHVVAQLGAYAAASRALVEEDQREEGQQEDEE